jgi:hypothetical protein
VKRTALLFTCLILLNAGAARADSDGYYCLGPGYVAWQFGMAPPSVRPHRLSIVTYGNGAMSQPATILLPPFQVHGMRCRAGAVDVVSFYSTHTVLLDSAGKPIRVDSTALAAPGRLPPWAIGSQARNLALGSRAARTLNAERYTLQTDPNGNVYVLEIAAAADSVRECPPTITARIAESDRTGRELRVRILFRGTGMPACTRRNLAPTTTPTAPATRNPADVLLDALVFGVHSPVDVSPYSGALRTEFENYLRRTDAYRSPRPPAGVGEAEMVDAARVNYERRLVASARVPDAVALAVAYVDSLRPCYEWEGFHDCPEAEAIFAQNYQSAHPDGPFRDYLPLLAASRWLCAADAYDYERRPADAARSRRAYTEQLAIARASTVVMIRTAAARLAQRGRCLAGGP